MLRHFQWHSKRQALQWARSLLPKPGIQHFDAHHGQRVLGSFEKDKSRSHSSSSRGQGDHRLCASKQRHLSKSAGRSHGTETSASSISGPHAFTMPMQTSWSGRSNEPNSSSRTLGPAAGHQVKCFIAQVLTPAATSGTLTCLPL